MARSWDRKGVQDRPPSNREVPSDRKTDEEWAARYAAADTPWDLGSPHPELSLRLQDGRLAPPHEGATALVPGAGWGHDAIALARRGWQVTAVDFVGSLEHQVAPKLERLGGRFLVADAIRLDAAEPFDLVWDHTFFCAIQPAERAEWGVKAAELVKPGGQYAALVFPVGKPAEESGPPFGMDCDSMLAALGPFFNVRESEPVTRPLKRRTWREFWLRAEKIGLASRQ